MHTGGIVRMKTNEISRIIFSLLIGMLIMSFVYIVIIDNGYTRNYAIENSKVITLDDKKYQCSMVEYEETKWISVK